MGDVGHNRLRSFVQRVERLREEIDALNTDVSEVYKEAKGEGWNVHAMKALISERAKHAKNPDKFRELNDFVEIYRNALAGGTPYATRVHAENASKPEPQGHRPIPEATGGGADEDPHASRTASPTPIPFAPAHPSSGAKGGAADSSSPVAPPAHSDFEIQMIDGVALEQPDDIPIAFRRQHV